MPAQWTAEIIGEMHIHKISNKMIAAQLGWTAEYVSMVLNGKRKPKGAYEKFITALGELELQQNKEVQE